MVSIMLVPLVWPLFYGPLHPRILPLPFRLGLLVVLEPVSLDMVSLGVLKAVSLAALRSS